MPVASPWFSFTLPHAISAGWALLVVLLVTARCALGNKNVSQGEIILVNKLGSELILSHIPFQSDTSQYEFRQPLEGSLANFTPKCLTCSSSSPSIFFLEDRNVYTFLSDKYLSVLNRNGSLASLIPLGSSCHPLSLQPSTILTSSPLIIVCRSTSHQELVLEGKELSLTPPTKVGTDGGIFVESGDRLYSVTFNKRNLEYYDETAAIYNPLPLPTVDCMNGSTLHTLFLQPSYLLQCVMPDRTTVYVIHIQGGWVQAVHGSGRPMSAPDGEHFALIEGPSLQVYATNDLSIGARAKTFDSDIVHQRFLTTNYLAIATEKGEHNLIDLSLLFNSSSSSSASLLPGGAPLDSMWISPDVYAYVARGNGRAGIRLHLYNTTSGKAVDEKEIPAVPDLLLFLPRQAKIDPTPPLNVKGGSDGLSFVEIAGVVSAAVMVCIVLVVVVVVAVGVMVSRVRAFRGRQRGMTGEHILLCGNKMDEEVEPEEVQIDTTGANTDDVPSHSIQATDDTSVPSSSSHTPIQATDHAPSFTSPSLTSSHPPPSNHLPSDPPPSNHPPSHLPSSNPPPPPPIFLLLPSFNELRSASAESTFQPEYVAASTEARPDKEEAVL